VIDDAIRALREGQFILLYDFDEREGETDFAIRSDAVTPAHVARMRREGGGLICTAIHPDAARAMGLPFATDLLSLYPGLARLQGEAPYDRKNKSSFSLWVNHRDTYTGITDRDRALTINAIASHVKRSLNGGGQISLQTSGHPATSPSCGRQTRSSPGGVGRPSSRSPSPRWQACRRQSPSARCSTIRLGTRSTRSRRGRMPGGTASSSWRAGKSSRPGKHTGRPERPPGRWKKRHFALSSGQ